jgi:hypothetical protein
MEIELVNKSVIVCILHLLDRENKTHKTRKHEPPQHFRNHCICSLRMLS